MNIGQRVLINAPQGSQFDDATGVITSLLDGDSVAVQIDDRPLLPPMMFGPRELIVLSPLVEVDEPAPEYPGDAVVLDGEWVDGVREPYIEPMGGWEPRS